MPPTPKQHALAFHTAVPHYSYTLSDRRDAQLAVMLRRLDRYNGIRSNQRTYAFIGLDNGLTAQDRLPWDFAPATGGSTYY